MVIEILVSYKTRLGKSTLFGHECLVYRSQSVQLVYVGLSLRRQTVENESGLDAGKSNYPDYVSRQNQQTKRFLICTIHK